MILNINSKKQQQHWNLSQSYNSLEEKCRVHKFGQTSFKVHALIQNRKISSISIPIGGNPFLQHDHENNYYKQNVTAIGISIEENITSF